MSGDKYSDSRERMRRNVEMPTSSSELMQFAVRCYLENLAFPTDKPSLVAQAVQWGAPPEVMEMLNAIEDRQYQNAAEVTGDLGMMQQ